MEKSTHKISYLEGIRGVAALLVFFHHFGLAFYPAYFTHNVGSSHLDGADVSFGQSVWSVFLNGNYCVYVFFVLSGYVLSRKYFQTRVFSILLSGAHRRFLRLFIPIAAAILTAFLLMEFGLFYNVPASSVTHSEWWLGSMWTFPDVVNKMVSTLIYGTMFLGDSSFDTTLSSMSIEFYGSLFVFAFLALTHHTRNMRGMLLFVLAYCWFVNNTYTASFAFGILLNYLEERGQALAAPVANTAAVLLLLVGLVLGSFPTNGMIDGTIYESLPRNVLYYSYWCHPVGAFFLVSAFVLSRPLQRFISLRPFIFLGYISFSLYLLHPIIIGSLASYIFLKLSETMSYHGAVSIVLLVSLGACVPLSWLMTKYVDVPGTAFARSVYERFAKPAEALAKQK